MTYALITYAVHLLQQVSKYFLNIVQRHFGNLNLLSFIDLSLNYAPKIIAAVPSVCASHRTVGKEEKGCVLATESQQEFSEHMHNNFSINKIATKAPRLRSGEGREVIERGNLSLYI